MDGMIYILFISIFVPIMLMANLIEKKARLPIVFVLTGMFISVFASEVNGVMRVMLPLSGYDLIGQLLPISTYVPFLVWRLKKKRLKRKA